MDRKTWMLPNSGLRPGVPVERIPPEENYGLGVSTVLTSDCGFETALLDANGAHPVERYPDEISARAGHARWVASSKLLERVPRLGWDDEERVHVEIERIPYGVEN